MSPYKKSFVNTLVFEHFKLEVCSYGKNAKNITDVYWKEGCRIPTMMVSDIAQLIEKGVIIEDEINAQSVFKATVSIFNLQRTDTINDIKALLVDFKQNFYSERGKNDASVNLHFFDEQDGRDIFTFFKTSVTQFANVELIVHNKSEEESK